MKKSTTNFGVNLCAGFVTLAFCATFGYAGTTPLASGPSLAKTAPSTSGVVYSAVGSTGIQASFPRKSALGTSDLAAIAVDRDVPGSPFFGDYVERGINVISLNVSGSGHQPSPAELQIMASGRLWRYLLEFPETEGTVSAVQVPLKTGEGWKAFRTSGLTADELSALLGGDLVDVTAISVVITPQQVDLDWPVQHYVFDNVVLVNDDGISSLPATLSPTEAAVQAAFITRFGYGYGSASALTDEMKGWDGDGDGMADFMELWSEKDRNYANSIFSAEDIEVVGDGVKVTWTCVASNRYTVVRANSLGGSFLPVSGLNAEATETGYMTLTDTNAPAGCYYRIRKH